MVVAAVSPLSAGTGPRVVETYPKDGALDVPVVANITVTFDRAMDPATLDPEKILVGDRPLSQLPEATAIMPDPQGGQMVILMRMHIEQVYRLTLLPGVADTEGNTLDKPFTWQFATSSRSDDPAMPPKAFARYPRFADRDVPTNSPITMFFTTEMDAASFTPETLIIHRHLDDLRLTGTVRIHGQRVIFQPDLPLEPQAYYEARITTGVRSKSGLSPVADSSWDFTTGDGPTEGPIVADAWVETYTDDHERKIILHAAVENLVLPGKRAAGTPLEVGTLASGQTLRGTVIPVSVLDDNEPVASMADGKTDPSVVASFAEADTAEATVPAGGKSVVAIAAYPDTELRETHEQKLARVAGGLLARPEAVVLSDSGNVFTHGDRTSKDGTHAARVVLNDKVGGGPGLATFAIVLPNGRQTPPVAVPFYIPPPPGTTPPEDPTKR